MPTFGDTTQGSGYGDLAGNVIGAIQTCPENGYATFINVWLRLVTSSDRIRGGLYSYPELMLIGETEERTGITDLFETAGLLQLAFPTAIPLVVGQQYVIVVEGTGSISIFFTLGTGPSLLFAQPYGPLPASIAGASQASWGLSIFCTYETGAPPPVYSLQVTVNDLVMGTTDPAPDVYAYIEGATVQVTAMENAGYQFDHWELDGVNIGSINPTTVTMDINHALLAVFNAIPPPLTHVLSVASVPIQGISFTVEKVS